MLLGARDGKSGPWIMILLRHIYSWHRYTHTHTGCCCSWWSLVSTGFRYPALPLPLYALSLPNMKTSHSPFLTPPLSLSPSLSTDTCICSTDTHTGKAALLLPPSSTWLLVSACGPNPCVIDGILPDANTHTHTHMLAHRHTLVAHSTIQSHTVRPQWLILADPWWPIKRAWRLTGCSAALIYWVGSVVSPFLPCCNYFLFA